MNFSLKEKEKARKRIFETIFEYAGSCHVENIVKQMEEEYQLDEQTCFPDELDAKIRDIINNYSKKSSYNNKTLKTVKNTLTKAAVFLVIILSTMGIFAMNVEAIRIRVLNFITAQTNQYTNVEIKEESHSRESFFDIIPGNWEVLYAPTYIPQGFAVDKIKNYTNVNIIFYLNDITGKVIMFEQGINKETNLRADTESANVDKIMINNFEGLMIKKEEEITIVWHNDDFSFTLRGQIDKDELLSIAESVKIIE